MDRVTGRILRYGDLTTRIITATIDRGTLQNSFLTTLINPESFLFSFEDPTSISFGVILSLLKLYAPEEPLKRDIKGVIELGRMSVLETSVTR